MGISNSNFVVIEKKRKEHMNKLNRGILWAIFALTFGFGCTYHYRVELPVTNTCDTTIKYTFASVDSIFNKSDCAGCHFAGNDPIVLEDSATIRAYIRSNKDKFLKAIKFLPPNPMPKGGSAIPAAEVAIIEKWICQGMK